MLVRAPLLTALWLWTVPVAPGASATGPPPPFMDPRALLGRGRLFFGHQSVGRDLLAGIAELDPAWKAVSTTRPDTLPPGSVAEAPLGTNGDPASKDRAFLAIVRRMRPGDVAFYKYCYADFDESTDVAQLFRRYVATLEEAARSGVRVFAVTAPLTAPEPAWKRWAKRLLRRPTENDRNARRTDFNRRLRLHFRQGGVLDLARLESTRAEGSRCIATVRGRPVEFLDPDSTHDGAHLNEEGRRRVARGFFGELVRALGP